MAKPLMKAYHDQKNSALRRKIAFKLSFAEWLVIWTKSRRLHLRGRGLGFYVMSRIGDVGPYAVGNVRIVKWESNAKSRSHDFMRGEGNWRARLTAARVRRIRAAYVPRSRDANLKALADRFGIPFQHVHAIVTRKSWSHVA